MAETDEITTSSPPPLSESDNSTILTTLESDEAEKKKPEGGISLRIWPPTQKTRDAVVNRLIETLSTESMLSKRYGILKSDEALTVAKSIEDEAYAVASATVFGDDDGIEILKAYSKEISKRMLDSVKNRTVASPTLTVANDTEVAIAAVDPSADSTEAVKDDDESEDSMKIEA